MATTTASSLIDLDSTPPPGEPLRPLTDPVNQAALDEQLEARKSLMRARLSRRELRSLKRRYARLHTKLNRARYNSLVKQRAALHDEYVMIAAAHQHSPTKETTAKGRALAKKGQALNARIAPLEPLAAEFANVSARLRAHERVLQLEQEEKENRAAFYREASVFEQQLMAVFRQSPRLHHIEKTDRGEKVRTPQIARVMLKPDKMFFMIRTTRQGMIDRFAGVWHSALPYGVDVKSLTCDETLENLTAACGRIVTAERNQRSQNLFYVINRLDSADGIPRRVAYEQIADYYPKADHVDTPWAAGVGPDRKIVWQTFTDFPHALIAGTNGGGKSNLINQMLATIITMNSPDEVRLVLIDNKGGVELSHFDNIPHLLLPTVTQIDNVLPTLQQLSALMRERFSAFLNVGARKLSDFNKRIKQPIPRLIIVVDEMATLVGVEDTQEIQRELRNISSQGRAVGVHLVISTQHPSVDVIPGWIKTNLNLRIAAKMPHHTASQIIVDSISAAILPDIPGRMVFRRGGYELTLQTPLIEDPGIARAVSIARQYPAAAWQISDSRAAAAAMVPRFTMDDFIRGVLEQCDGNISARKMWLLVGSDVATETTLTKMAVALREQIAAAGNLFRWEDQSYRMRRVGRAYQLQPIPDLEATESQNDQHTGFTLSTAST